MTPTRKRRLIMIGAILIAAAAATTLIVLALQQNMTYLFTPSEILAGKVPDGARFRIGGMVKQGSVERGQSLTVAFVVTDGYPVWVCFWMILLGAFVGAVGSATAASRFLDV